MLSYHPAVYMPSRKKVKRKPKQYTELCRMFFIKKKLHKNTVLEISAPLPVSIEENLTAGDFFLKCKNVLVQYFFAFIKKWNFCFGEKIFIQRIMIARVKRFFFLPIDTLCYASNLWIFALLIRMDAFEINFY